jgi:catechol 2,3-dioxygenase-like lactoylglutathione lyase family enzyme
LHRPAIDVVKQERGTIVENLSARTVFFVKDAERSLRFYTETLGFTLDWNHQEQERAFVFQVSLLGFQLILNQTEPRTENRAGHGRVFIGIDQDQVGPFRRHLEEKHIKTTALHWGAPTLVIRDVDENELFIWLPESERASLEAELASASVGPHN